VREESGRPGRRIPLFLLPYGTVPEEPLRQLGRALEERLPVGVRIEPVAAIDPGWRAKKGPQLLADAVLDHLVDLWHPGSWLLGVVDADLLAPRRDFVFGAATVGGGCALVGLARLGDRRSAAFPRRLLAEALHELGHVAGLDHCTRSGCLMSPAADRAEVDRRGLDFCHDCGGRISGG
jgi:archaemetzincin